MVVECSVAGRGVVRANVLIATLLRCTISTESLAGTAESSLLASLAIATLAGLSIATLERLTISTLAWCTIATLAESALDALEAADAAFTAAEATAAISAAMALAGALNRSLSGSTISTEAALQGAGVASKAVIATMDLFSGSAIAITSTWSRSGDGSREDCENEGLHDMNLIIFLKEQSLRPFINSKSVRE